MSQRSLVRFVLLLGLGATLTGCWTKTPDRVRPPSINASSAGAEAIKMYDTNKDGKISGAELDACPAIKFAIAQIDRSGKGEVTADMVTNRILDWQKTRIGKMTVACVLTHNGSPLSGVTVTLVPEKFLGSEVKSATGKSDRNGTVMLSIPPDNTAPGVRQTPGVAPGLYRVVVTDDAKTIPPKYSTESGTILGMEVARDAKGAREGVKFDLQY
jgi:hypothetical protein